MATSSIYRNSVVYILLGFMGPGVNFFLLPLYTRVLPTSEFGIITLATILQAFLANLTTLGLTGAFSRIFFDYERSVESEKTLFSVAFFSMLGAGLLVNFFLLWAGDFILGFLLSNNEFTYTHYGKFIGITAICMNLQALILGLYRNREDIRSYGAWAVFFFLSQAIGIFIGIVTLRMGALGNIEGRMWGAMLPLLCFLGINQKTFRIGPNAKAMLASMLVFGGPLVPYLLINLAYNNIDKILLERYFSLQVLGLYGFAFMVVSISEIFINAIQSATYPSLYRELKLGEHRNQMKVERILTLIVLANLSLMVLISSLAGLVINAFIGNSYHSVVSYLPLLAITVIPRVFSIIYGTTLMYYGKTKILPMISLTSFVVTCSVGIAVIPIWGVFGVVLALFLSQVVQLSLSVFFTKRYRVTIPESLRLKSEWVIAANILIAVIVSTLLYHFVYPAALWYLIILFSFVFSTWTLHRKLMVLVLEKVVSFFEQKWLR